MHHFQCMTLLFPMPDGLKSLSFARLCSELFAQSGLIVVLFKHSCTYEEMHNNTYVNACYEYLDLQLCCRNS